MLRFLSQIEYCIYIIVLNMFEELQPILLRLFTQLHLQFFFTIVCNGVIQTALLIEMCERMEVLFL